MNTVSLSLSCRRPPRFASTTQSVRLLARSFVIDLISRSGRASNRVLRVSRTVQPWPPPSMHLDTTPDGTFSTELAPRLTLCISCPDLVYIRFSSLPTVDVHPGIVSSKDIVQTQTHNTSRIQRLLPTITTITTISTVIVLWVKVHARLQSSHRVHMSPCPQTPMLFKPSRNDGCLHVGTIQRFQALQASVSTPGSLPAKPPIPSLFLSLLTPILASSFANLTFLAGVH